MKKLHENRKLVKILCLIFGILFIVPLISGFSILLSEKSQVESFLAENGIVRFPIKAPTQDKSHISAVVYINEADLEITSKSVPTIIFVPGANNQKYNLFNLKYQAFKFGYAVVAMEQRGHGESGGYFTLYEKEYQDISDVITYLETNFLQLNSSHIALIGMSLGGGSAVGAQALDDRIHASSIYHPAANISDMFSVLELHPFDYFGFLPGMSYPYYSKIGFQDWDSIKNETWYYRDSINLVNQTNTKNLLLLQGSEDDMIRPETVEAIAKIADPDGTRADIQFVLREGIGHGSNERNLDSFKYTITWFNHFFKNASIDITKLSEEVNYVELYEDTFPSVGNYKTMFTYASVLLIPLLFCVFYMFLFPKSVEINLEDLKKNYRGSDESEIKKKYRFTLLIRSGVVILSYFIASLIAAIFNPSPINVFFFYPTVVLVPLLLFLPNTLKDNSFPLDQIKQWTSKEKVRDLILSYLIFAVPFFIMLELQNLGGTYTIEAIVRPEFSIGIMNILKFATIFIMPFLLMRELPGKYAFLIIPVTIASVMIASIIVPVKPIPIVPFSNLALLIAIAYGLLNFLVYCLILCLQKILTRNLLATHLIIGTIAAVMVWMRFMRII